MFGATPKAAKRLPYCMGSTHCKRALSSAHGQTKCPRTPNSPLGTADATALSRYAKCIHNFVILTEHSNLAGNTRGLIPAAERAASEAEARFLNPLLRRCEGSGLK